MRVNFILKPHRHIDYYNLDYYALEIYAARGKIEVQKEPNSLNKKRYKFWNYFLSSTFPVQQNLILCKEKGMDWL